MSVNDELLKMLSHVAEALGEEMRERLVFVGGCTTALFITDPVVVEEVRFTDDVDLIVDLVGVAAWGELQAALRAKGFKESLDEEVICRMRLGYLKVDFMPDDEKILGFSNRWYRRGIETAEVCELYGGVRIRRLAPPFFLATKLEAWLGRGRGDPLVSKDLEDILLVVDGRPELVAEVAAADADVRRYIAEQVGALLETPRFDDVLDSNIRGSAGRIEVVAQRLEALSRVSD